MKSELRNGAIEKRMRQLGQGTGVKLVTCTVLFVDGKPYLMQPSAERYEMDRGADMGSIVDVIATNLIPPKVNGTGRRRKKGDKITS